MDVVRFLIGLKSEYELVRAQILCSSNLPSLHERIIPNFSTLPFLMWTLVPVSALPLFLLMAILVDHEEAVVCVVDATHGEADTLVVGNLRSAPIATATIIQ